MTTILTRDAMGRVLTVAREWADKKCPNCKEMFRPMQRTQKFCSRICKFEIRDTDEHFAEYFWARVNKSNKCWTWKNPRGKGAKGYNEAWRRGKRILAHRAAWELTHGPITDGLWVLHKCDNPPCVRPDHLFLGTSDDNNKDMAAKNRTAHGSRNGWSKLTEDSVAVLKAEYAAGINPKAIAARLGISDTTVYKIGSGNGWVRVKPADLTLPLAGA